MNARSRRSKQYECTVPNMLDFFQANTPRRIKGLLGPRSADCLLIVPVSDISLVIYFLLNPNHIGLNTHYLYTEEGALLAISLFRPTH